MTREDALKIVRECCDYVPCNKQARDKIEEALAWLEANTVKPKAE